MTYLDGESITAIHESSDGTVWFDAGWEGVIRFDPTKVFASFKRREYLLSEAR